MFDIQLLVRTKKYRHDNSYCFSACLIGQTHNSSLCDSDSSYLPTLVHKNSFNVHAECTTACDFGKSIRNVN